MMLMSTPALVLSGIFCIVVDGASVAIPQPQPQRLASVGNLYSVAQNATQNCSTYDFSNGTICGCGKAMEDACSAFRGSNTDECAACVASVTFEGEVCSHSFQQNFCASCSPDFSFEWIDQVPKVEDETINWSIFKSICRLEPITNATQVDDPNLRKLVPLLRIFGCSSFVSNGLLTGLGYNETAFANGFDNSTKIEQQTFHRNTVDFLLMCCEDPSAHKTCQSENNFIWAILRKATHCRKSDFINELEELGLDIQYIGNNYYKESYAIDLVKLSLVLQPAIGVVLRQLYASIARFMTGLSIAAATRHGCGNSWFVPGADLLYANSFLMQADFYFPSNTPSPFASTGTCGKSLTSEQTRLDVCDKVMMYLYDNAHLSGMSLLGCSVDCTASRLDGVEGAFVSAVIGVVEVDTNRSGFSKAQHGIANAVSSLNAQGLNVSNDVHSTVGIGFRFSSKQYSSENILETIDWDPSNQEQTDIKFTASTIIPNMTAAMIAFEDSHHHKPSTPSHPKPSTTTIILAAVIPAAVLAGVVIGMALRHRHASSVAPTWY
eukprot:m.13125 g.13125  ORF g.13125 m.13125 type:complete len:550 (-) comp9603_c0_seq1:198-1847(-)